jgi:hypothetical protein
MTFWRALAAGGQGSCCRSAIDLGLMVVMAARTSLGGAAR